MIRAIIAATLLIALYGVPVAAQMACGSRPAIIAQLAGKYGESRVGGGVSGGALLEVFANPETGTWTVLRSFPNGAACLMAAGESWMPGGSEKEPGDPA